ncbi:hypothetical protein BI313_16055 [Xanthomonas vesicatoria]|nr:hypothetical protein BI313_16055 [Xanthomonas vesicatoria]
MDGFVGTSGPPEVRRECGALAARGTRRKYVPVGSVAASMPPQGPAIGKGTTPESWLAALLKNMHADPLDWSLPAHHRGTLCGMDAA